MSLFHINTQIQLRQIVGHNPTKVRHYVDEIENLLAADDHVYFGEHDGEDLSDWTDEQIWGVSIQPLFWRFER